MDELQVNLLDRQFEDFLEKTNYQAAVGMAMNSLRGLMPPVAANTVVPGLEKAFRICVRNAYFCGALGTLTCMTETPGEETVKQIMRELQEKFATLSRTGSVDGETW